MLSENQLKVAELYNIPIGNVDKLVSNLLDKEKCMIHYENLKNLLEARIKTKKIHRILEFNQSKWIKTYIEFNTQKR